MIHGDEEHSIKSIMNSIEASCGKAAGNTKAKLEIPLFDIFAMAEDFFTGITHDRNMAEMIDTFAGNGEKPVAGECFWKASGLSPEQKFSSWYQNASFHEDEHMAAPTFGAYKQVSLD